MVDEDQLTIEKNLTDVDSVDLDRDINLGKEEESINNMFFNQQTRAGRQGTMAGEGNQGHIDAGFADGFGADSEFENHIHNRSNVMMEEMNQPNHARNNSILD